MTGNTDVVLYKCDLSDKSYTIKSSYHSHLRLKHKAVKSADGLENGSNASRRKKDVALSTWIENEIEDPGMWTRNLDSYLENQNDISLAAAAFESEQAIQEEIMVEKLGVKYHEIEWFEEDHNSGFIEEFRSDFASSLRSETQLNKEGNVAKLHNDIILKLNEKYDVLVIKSERSLKSAEKSKNILRKKVNSLNNQLIQECKSLEVAKNIIKKYAGEVTNLKVNLQVEQDLVVALKLKYEKEQSDKSDSQNRNVTKPGVEDNLEKEGPLPKKEENCEKCNFKTRNRVLMSEQIDKFHGGFKCLMCAGTFKTKNNFLKHKRIHDAELSVGRISSYPMNVYMFKCTPCELSFKTGSDQMDHLSEVHLTEAQRRGDGLAKYKSGHHAISQDANRLPNCKNGDSCYFHKQHRCNFHHALPPQERQVRSPRQAPTSQWQSANYGRSHNKQQGRGDKQTREQQAQGSRSSGAPRDTSRTWCKHSDNCLQGRFCVLRVEGERDFPRRMIQSRK